MIKALMTIGKFVAGIGGLATIIWAGFTFYDRVMDRFDDLEYGIGDNTEMVNEALKVAKENRDSLEVLVERQDEQDQNMVEMRSAMQFYFHNQKEYTAEQMSILMEQLLSSQKKTPYQWENLLIPQDSDIYAMDNENMILYSPL